MTKDMSRGIKEHDVSALSPDELIAREAMSREPHSVTFDVTLRSGLPACGETAQVTIDGKCFRGEVVKIVKNPDGSLGYTLHLEKRKQFQWNEEN